MTFKRLGGLNGSVSSKLGTVMMWYLDKRSDYLFGKKLIMKVGVSVGNSEDGQ